MGALYVVRTGSGTKVVFCDDGTGEKPSRTSVKLVQTSTGFSLVIVEKSPTPATRDR